MKKKYPSLLALAIAALLPVSASAMSELKQLTDQELSEQTGQALLSMGFTAPSGSGTGANPSDFGFYKLGLEGKMELNANIKNMQLGCGGVNGAGNCDIDMSNVSLSGPADGKAADGTPIWSKGRANSSAVITNPFIEFAIKNPNSPATREVSGFRLSAEEILGYLSAGTANVANPTDGIKSFSGFLKVAETPVNSFTDPTSFGTTDDQRIFAKISSLGIPRTVFTDAGAMLNAPPAGLNIAQWGIAVPRQEVKFNFPETIVTGNRLSQLNLVVKDVPIPTITIGSDSGAIKMKLDEPINAIVTSINDSTFYMGEKTMAQCGSGATIVSGCTYITNLKANVTVKQNFNLIHNLPITSGGYLGLQSTAVKWPGSDAADTAQRGWWLSFKDPLDFGALNPTAGIPMQDVLPQIATFITNYLSLNNIALDAGNTWNALVGLPIYKGIGDVHLADNARAVMVLENLLLDSNQRPVSNCFGNLKFC
ncbi:hypothetical protein [Acinetobacter sp. WZC-1]|uniref:hypothetical protein n=1 Tax=Acinetobacter sp. WZC-1 TaxID=3459034 RepID=UPI00403DC73F